MTPQVFAILNVTPDSFSDGGQFSSVDEAVARGIELRQQGADIVDVGGESTRPGAERVDPAEEQERVIPVITGLVAAGVPVSVDTMNASTAFAAAEAGASVINDVSGGLADPEMYRVVAQTQRLYIAMHWRGHSTSMDDLATYDDVVIDVRNELKSRLAEMFVWGVEREQVVLDPGLGFAKNAAHNWQLLGRLDELQSLGHPLLIGASRKRFLADVLPDDATTADRDLPTAVVSAFAAQAGAWGLRVHDVPSTRAALGVVDAWKNGRSA
ncbi:MAG: dihydropteroate synthase [Salinibacterium sp.]|nr:dihydropteroate synthase [Salinibacterium sp.]